MAESTGTRRTPHERFWSKVNKTDGCWLWTGVHNGVGYGQFHLQGADGRRQRYAHRVAYEWQHGPIPDGMELDHLCRTPACVRPSHLDAVPHATNFYRGASAAAERGRQTHCQNGHTLSGDNLKLTRDSRGFVHRTCRTCYRAWWRRQPKRPIDKEAKRRRYWAKKGYSEPPPRRPSVCRGDPSGADAGRA